MHSDYATARKIAILILTPIPWPAADPLVGLLEHAKCRTRGPARTRASAPRLVAAMLLCGTDAFVCQPSLLHQLGHDGCLAQGDAAVVGRRLRVQKNLEAGAA